MVLDAMTLLAFMAHRDSVDIWQDGNPIDYWIDEYGFRCIRYESGRWWRYHLVGTTWKWFRLKHDGVYAEIKPDLLNEPRLNWLDYLIVSIDSSKTPRNRYSRGFFKTYEY